jgi:hypothetical protein
VYTVNKPQAIEGKPGHRHTQVAFASLTELVRNGLQRDGDVPTDSGRQSVSASPGWSGSDSLQHATDLALNGWADGVNRIANLAERISEKVARRVEAHGMDLWEEGGEVDVAAYLDGQRACMWTWTEQDNKRPIVRVSVNVSARSGTTTDEYTVAGAIAAALVDALENAGRRVELTVLCAISMGSSPGNIVFSADLKRADEPLDLGTVAYALAHPSMLRRTLFSVMENTPQAWRKHYEFSRHGSYGYVTDAPEELRGDVHLDLHQATKLGVDGGYDWILARLAEQGVDVRAA